MNWNQYRSFLKVFR